MTIGQLIECLVGKVSAIQGHETDGTPFGYPDIESYKDILQKLGYERNGYEYLFNGMTGKKIKTMIFIGPTYYQRLKHMVSDKIHCLTMDHEVLTDNGWKYYPQLSMNDKIATLKNDQLVYETPIDIMYYPNYSGHLYHIKTNNIDLNVTTNHRMFVSMPTTNGWGSFGLHKAEDIQCQPAKYKKDAEWNTPDYQFRLPSTIDDRGIHLAEQHVNMDAWLTFFGTWISNGSVTDGVQINNADETIAGIIKKMGFVPYLYRDRVSVFDAQLVNYMKSLGTTKCMPNWVWQLSKTQCQKLMNAMTKQTHYQTTSERLADDMMKLCLHAGWVANKHYVSVDSWGIEIIKDGCDACVNYGETYEQIERTYEFTGPVFCLMVPSEVFYVRRNGVGTWTGNSRGRGPRTLLTHQACEGRSIWPKHIRASQNGNIFKLLECP
jgi:hypothetical protein